MNPSPGPLYERLAQLELRLLAEARLAPEFSESRGEFFQGRAPAGVLERNPAARLRHLEWFLFERVSPTADVLGIELAAEVLGAASGFDDELERHALAHSFAGVFEVASHADDGSLWLSDLSMQGEFPVEPGAATALARAGDLYAGRLYPLPSGGYLLSPAAAHFRNADLLKALREDLSRARAGRRGIVRISQRELERMFFAAGPTGAPADPVGEARALLLSAGVEREELEEWLEALTELPFPERELQVGVDEALAPILDRLAFDSEIDLDAARRALVFAWQEMSRRGAGKGASLVPQARPAEAPTRLPDAARALAHFEERRRQGAPLEAVFQALEAELQVDDLPDPDEVEEPSDLPGVVSALVTEFLWEVERTEGDARAQELRRIEPFGRFAERVEVFENLNARDLLSYTAWWLPESGELANADDARATLAALGSFCQWADETQETELRARFDEFAPGLERSLPRIVEANRRRTRAASPTQGELFEVVRIEPHALRLRDRRGVEHEAHVEADLATWLTRGDRLRAQLHEDRRLAVYCCYPPEAGGLEGDVRPS